MQQISDVNEHLRRGGEPATASLKDYCRCSHCGADTVGFLPAVESDAPPGVTIQPVVLIARAELGEHTMKDAWPAVASFTVEGEVLEVLGDIGLAHVRIRDGSTFGLNRQTPGIQFADLREGQRVRVEVTHKFNRVLHAQLLG
jgi:hypothetical protein